MARKERNEGQRAMIAHRFEGVRRWRVAQTAAFAMTSLLASAASPAAFAQGAASAPSASAPPASAPPASSASPEAPSAAPAPPGSPSTPSPRDAWKAHYDEARTLLAEGEYAAAAAAFDTLEREATVDSDRELAREMGHVASNLARRAADKALPGELAPSVESQPRTSDEITILYASAFLYGIGTGAWFLLQTQPDSAATATLPFVALTAAPVIALATIDGHRPLRRSVAHSITAGLYLGLGEGLWLVAYQHARADRKDAASGGSTRWPAETTSSVLWGGTTIGAIVGGALGAEIATTPGRVSFAASTALWSGVLVGLTASAFIPESTRHAEDAALSAGIGYNAGLLSGIFLAGPASPSVTRVRVVDLSGAAGVLVASGLYFSLAGRNTDSRIGSGVAALGGASGLVLGAVLTQGMPGERPTNASPASSKAAITWQPMASPTTGGGMIGVAGTL